MHAPNEVRNGYKRARTGAEASSQRDPNVSIIHAQTNLKKSLFGDKNWTSCDVAAQFCCSVHVHSQPLKTSSLWKIKIIRVRNVSVKVTAATFMRQGLP
ncbi:hypothetical protein Peur_072839 [Populus x canadensis]